MATCDVDDLLAETCADNFICAPPKVLRAVRLQLLCDLNSGPPAPPAPTNLRFNNENSGPGNVGLLWDVASAPDSFEIWKSINGGAYFLFDAPSGGIVDTADTTGMASADIWKYKIRSIVGGIPSAFSNVITVVNGIDDPGTMSPAYSDPAINLNVDIIDLSSSISLATVSLPNLIYNILGIIDLSICHALNSIDFSSLIYCAGFSCPEAAIPSLSFPALVTDTQDFNVDTCNNLTSLSIPVLATVGNSFITTNTGLINLSAPSLTVVGLNFDSSSCPALASISMPVLASVGSDFFVYSCPSLTTLNLAALTSVGGVFYGNNCTSLTTLNLAALTSVGGDFDCDSCPSLTTLNLAALTSVGGGFYGYSCPSLTTLNLAALTSVGGDFDCSNCPLLVSLSIPNLIFTDGKIISVGGGSLNAASVNQVLARGVASGVTTCTFNMNAVGDAAPTGQGIIDKAALITAGNTVNTN